MERRTSFQQTVRAMLLAAVAGTAGAGQAQAQVDSDTAAWEAARAAGTAEACQAYLEAFPTGRFAEDAFRCIVEQTIPGAGQVPLGGVAPSADMY